MHLLLFSIHLFTHQWNEGYFIDQLTQNLFKLTNRLKQTNNLLLFPHAFIGIKNFMWRPWDYIIVYSVSIFSLHPFNHSTYLNKETTDTNSFQCEIGIPITTELRCRPEKTEMAAYTYKDRLVSEQDDHCQLG